MVGTLIFYLTVMSICVLLIYSSNNDKSKFGIYLAYIILVLLSIFRFNIGNDYASYANLINEKARLFRLGIPLQLFSTGSAEPSFEIFTYIFQYANYPYVWVIGIHSIISFIFLYLILNENGSHLTGILIFFIIGMLFANWDQVRQGVSIIIFIFAIKYIKENNFLKYSFFLLLAASFHYSALLVLPFYFVNIIEPRKYLYIAVISFLAILNLTTSYFEWVYLNFIQLLPYFDTKEASAALRQIDSSNFKIRIIFYSTVWCAVIYYLPKKERALSNFLFIGAIIFIVASGALNLMRISFFFTFTTILSIPLVLQIYKAKKIILLMVFGLFLFFTRDIITNSNTRGCVPYESVFSYKFNIQSFIR